MLSNALSGCLMPDIQRILAARAPLTLSAVARGAQPLVLADIARAAQAAKPGARAVFIAPDESAMRAIADTASFFAPELDVIAFPAWDCLPYDRASPALSVSAQRLSALHRLQASPGQPQETAAMVTPISGFFVWFGHRVSWSRHV